MAERIKARAASIDADGSSLNIVLTFDGPDGRQQVGYTYSGDDVERFGKELLRQRAAGVARSERTKLELLDAESAAARRQPPTTVAGVEPADALPGQPQGEV